MMPERPSSVPCAFHEPRCQIQISPFESYDARCVRSLAGGQIVRASGSTAAPSWWGERWRVAFVLGILEFPGQHPGMRAAIRAALSERERVRRSRNRYRRKRWLLHVLYRLDGPHGARV